MYTLADLEKARANLDRLTAWYERHEGYSRTKYIRDVKTASLWVEVVAAALRANGEKTPPPEDA